MSKKDTTYLYDYKDKIANMNYHIKQTYNKSLAMFKYHNLPDTIPAKYLELFLQSNGYVGIAEYEGNLYAFNGGLGGKPDVYNDFTSFIVSNPALNLNQEFTIDKDCVIIDNDYMRQGMGKTFAIYASFLVENEISLMLANINTRCSIILSAGDSGTVSSAKEFLKQLEEGKQGVIMDNAFLESLKISNVMGSKSVETLQSLIQFNQYLKGSLLNSIGLNANTNLKKERLISAEIDVSNDGLYPAVDNMLECRRIGIEKINEMFGTKIEVEFNSSWDYRALNGMSVYNVNDEITMDEAAKLEGSANNEEDSTLDNGTDEEPAENLVDSMQVPESEESQDAEDEEGHQGKTSGNVIENLVDSMQMSESEESQAAEDEPNAAEDEPNAAEDEPESEESQAAEDEPEAKNLKLQMTKKGIRGKHQAM